MVNRVIIPNVRQNGGLAPVQEVPQKKRGCCAALQATYGLALMAGSACTFSVVTLLVSLLSTRFPMYQIVSVRFLTQWMCTALNLLINRQRPVFERKEWQPMLARCFFGIVSMVAFYLSLQHLAMANASVIRFTSPAMVVVLAHFMYKEPFGWVQAVSTFVSTVGVVLVAQPAFIFGSPPHEATADTKGGGSGTSAQQSVSIGFAFAAAFAAAFAFLAIRRVKGVPPMTTTFWFSLAGFLVLTPVAIGVGGMKVPDRWQDWLMLCSTGVVGYVGQLLMCRSLQLEAAGPATMMRYLDVAFAYLFQITVEKRLVDWLSPVGATLVVSGAAIITAQRWLFPSHDGNEDDDDADDETAPLRSSYPRQYRQLMPPGPRQHSLLVIRPSFRNESSRSGMQVPWL